MMSFSIQKKFISFALLTLLVSNLADAAENPSSCKNFSHHYARVSCTPNLPIANVAWGPIVNYLTAQELVALAPYRFEVKQQECDSLQLTYPKKIMLTLPSQAIDDYSYEPVEFWPEQTIKLGLSGHVRTDSLSFYALWLNDSSNRLLVNRTQNIGYGEIRIADTYEMFRNPSADISTVGFTRVISHGNGSSIGSSPRTLMTCRYIAPLQAPRLQAPYPSSSTTQHAPRLKASATEVMPAGEWIPETHDPK